MRKSASWASFFGKLQTPLYFFLIIAILKPVDAGGGGYFINLLQFPDLCPLTSFCAPWNPMNVDNSLTLIDHEKIQLSVHDIHILRARGRIKEDDKNCWSENFSGEFCKLFADTGYVICDVQGANGTKDNNDFALTYMVPKSCVEWKSDSDHMTRAFYSGIKLQIPILGNSGGRSQVIITLDKVLVDDANNFTWSEVIHQGITVGLTTISGKRPNQLLIEIHGVISLSIEKLRNRRGKVHLYIKIRALHSFWGSAVAASIGLPDSIGTSEGLNGLLGTSGFLESVYLAEQSSKLDGTAQRVFGCNPVAWYSYRYPLCRCQLARLSHIPLQYPQEIRIQACCDWWLGRAIQGEKKERPEHGLKRWIYFNDRLACAQGSEPLNSLDGSCDGNHCCRKTHLQAAKWDFKVREKCHVLRPISFIKEEDEEDEGSGQDEESEEEKARISIEAAYGIMIGAFCFIFLFRFINKKLEECRARVLSGG